MSLSTRTRAEPVGEAGEASAPPARRRRWRVLVLAVVALAVAGGIAAYVSAPRSANAVTGSGSGHRVVRQSSGPGKGLPKLANGVQAPGFSLARLGGGPPVTLAAERGHPVVLNFFASWCSDCRAELKAFAHVSNGPHGDVRFLGIDTNDTATAKAQSLLAAANDQYPVGVDPHATVANARYYVEALPETVFIGANGRIAGEVFGTQTVGSLTPWVHALEKGASAPKKPGAS